MKDSESSFGKHTLLDDLIQSRFGARSQQDFDPAVYEVALVVFVLHAHRKLDQLEFVGLFVVGNKKRV